MDILRVNLQGSKVTLFLLFVLSSAFIMTISTPRSASAEGPLLGTVRCLVQSVLLTNCQPKSSSPQPSAPAESSSPSTSENPAPASSPTHETNSPKGAATQQTYMPLPKNTIASDVPVSISPVTPSPTAASAYANMTKAEYLTYFNKYSKYAVAGAHDEAAAPIAIERTGEGWRFFGIAWYWWGLMGIIGAMLFYVIRQSFLRKSSVLPVVR